MSSNGVPMTFDTSEAMRGLADLELAEDAHEVDVVMRVKPTIVRLSTASIAFSPTSGATDRVAWLLKLDGETWTEMFKRDGVPYSLGVSSVGWYAVDEIRLPRDPGGGTDPVVAGWARLQLGVLDALPPYMILSSYDIGHPVVVTTGEFLGSGGMVTDVRRGSVILPGGAGHRTDAIGALRTGTRAGDARMAPLKVLCPKGSRVWARWEDGSWVSAVVSDYFDNDSYPKVELWRPDTKEEFLRDRDRREIIPGTEPMPQPTRVTRGKAGVPSSRSPFSAKITGPLG